MTKSLRVAGSLTAVAILTLAVPTVAQDLFSKPSQSRTTTNDAALSAAIAEWNTLRSNESLPFSAYANFLTAHPGWPGEAAMRKVAERALRPDSASPGQVIAFFRRFPAVTPASDLRLAEAFVAGGFQIGVPEQETNARAAARRAWTGGSLSNEDEARLLARFGSAITSSDHDARMDRLLWNRALGPAARQISLTSPAKQPAFAARLALLQKTPDALTTAGLIGDTARGDAGFIADRAYFLRNSGQELAGRALLAAPRTLSVRPLDVAKWFDILLSSAQAAASDYQFQTAYDIARRIDDAYPTGTDVRKQPLSERDDYTSLAWLAGSTALNQLRRPVEAMAMFDLYTKGARSPQTQTKGLYWAGRAAEAASRPAEATAYFKRAAVFFDQFHGQLAAERLGVATGFPSEPRSIEVSVAQRETFNAREIVRAAELLGARGDRTNQTLFVRALAAAAESDRDHILTAELATRINRPDLSVMIGRSAGINGYHDYTRIGFPVVPVPPEEQSRWTMVHAIARQESQFDRKIVSRAGARGLMQLMPGTARETAGKIGLGYNPESLDDPRYNIQLGSWYFARLLERFGGNHVLAVAAYNAGAGNVNKWLAANGDPRLPGTDVIGWIEKIPFSETRGYVQRVLENAVVYDMLNPARASVRRTAPLSAYLGKSRPG